MSKKSFVIYRNWWDMMMFMSPESAGIFIQAIGAYAFEGIETNFEDERLNMAFKSIKELLDIDGEKYEKKKARAAEAREQKKSKQISDIKSELKLALISDMKSTCVTDTDTVTDTVTPKGVKKDTRHKYGEYAHVLLTDAEYNRLCDEYGEIRTSEAIRYLDEYKERKGYKSKNDNLTLRKWVFKALDEDRTKDMTPEEKTHQAWLEKWRNA